MIEKAEEVWRRKLVNELSSRRVRLLVHDFFQENPAKGALRMAGAQRPGESKARQLLIDVSIYSFDGFPRLLDCRGVAIGASTPDPASFQSLERPLLCDTLATRSVSPTPMRATTSVELLSLRRVEGSASAGHCSRLPDTFAQGGRNCALVAVSVVVSSTVAGGFSALHVQSPSPCYRL